MKPEELILKIIHLYHDARLPTYIDERISRGRSRSISSIVEDLFAYYLLINNPSIDQILVDQHIKVAGQKVFYPDISVVRNGVITAFFDLKMDLGFMRDKLSKLCEDDANFLKNIQGKQCTFNDGKNKDSSELTISENAIYDIVVISNQNISESQLKEQTDAVKADPKLFKNVEIHILTGDKHPNEYGIEPNKLMELIKINKESFDEIESRAK